MPQIFDQNPNQLTGGDGCLYVGETGSKDCGGLYAELEGRVFSPISPRPVICEFHAEALVAEFARARAKGLVHRLPGRSKRSSIPDDPRARGQRPAVTDQPDSPMLTQDQLAEALKPPKRRGKAKPAVQPVVKLPEVDDTPDI